MIKIAEIDNPPNVYSYKLKAKYLKRQLIEVLPETQLRFLNNHHWVCRNHPAKSSRIEIFADIKRDSSEHTIARLFF